MKHLFATLACAASATPALAQFPPSAPPVAPSAAVSAAPDYRQDATWLCRPGRRDACDVNLDALSLTSSGIGGTERAQLSGEPPIDCFYVYPTVSRDPTPVSDLQLGPEEARSALLQAARFRSVCHVFAPVYRQITLAGLNRSLSGGQAPDWTPALADVRAAWRDYLQRDNGGRGVVLIGHSQGAILLGRLLAEEIEPDPAQSGLLVSAVLAGHPGLGVPLSDGNAGEQVGGDLRTTPLCRARSQTGCAVVFSTYAVSDQSPRFFGRVAAPGRAAACVHPGAPGGGKGPLDAYLPNPGAALGLGPGFLSVRGQLEGECVTDAGGSVLRVRVLPGPSAGLIEAGLARANAIPGWGLHVLDVNLALGSLLTMIEAQSRAWTAREARAGAQR